MPQRHPQPGAGVSEGNSVGTAATAVPLDVLIVGAGPAGLSMAGRLHHLQSTSSYIVLEREEPGAAWRSRYDRLHLHTVRQISALPYWGFPAGTPTFVSAKVLADYYSAYAQRLRVRSHTTVTAARFDAAAKLWNVTAVNGRPWQYCLSPSPSPSSSPSPSL